MSIINENPRIADVVLYEAGRDINYTRDAITVLSGTVASAVGQVLGQITLGTATSAAKGGGNTGTGTLTLDVTTPVLANAKPGIYTVTILATGRAVVNDPLGVELGEVEFASSGSVTFTDRIKFVLADASTHFVAGDGFTVTIAAGSGKWTQVTPAALDGSQNAAGVLVSGAFAATLGADASAVAITRGPAVLKSNGLVWTSGMTTPQQTTATAQLLALGITTRTDYGV